MNPTVSMIVPVYNAEDYIGRCLDSILNQEYTDFELILVDDGSADTSGAICDQYAARDPRIKVFHRENSGVSDTRNFALSKASGTYLQFLDSDDWITPDATRLLVRAALEHQCDMVIADFYRVVGDRVSHKGDIQCDRVLSREEFAEYMMENPADYYYGVLWNKLYRRDLVEQYHLRMDSHISWCEDFLFNLEYLLHAETYFALQTPIYYYVKRRGSLATQGLNLAQTVKMKLMVFEYYSNFYKNIYDERDYERKLPQVYRFLIDAAKDGVVPPAIFPSAKKLGDERSTADRAAAAGDDVLSELYRSLKLLVHYFEVPAIKYDITVTDVMLLRCLSASGEEQTRKKIADFLNISVRSVSLSLQRLMRKSFIRVLPAARGSLQISLLPAAEPLLKEIGIAEKDFQKTCFQSFTEEELEVYHALSERIRKNMLQVLL